MTLGQKIRRLKNEKGLTQKDLADQLHVTFQTISKWENDENEPDVASLKRLAAILECTLDELLNVEIEEQEREENDDKGGFIVNPESSNPASKKQETNDHLTSCPVCKKEVSKTAEICPQCGQRLIPTKPSPAPRIVHYESRASQIIQREHNIKHIAGIIGGVFIILISIGLFFLSLWAMKYSQTEGTLGIVFSIVFCLTGIGLILWCKYRLDNY